MPKAEQSLNEILYDLRRIEEHRELLTEKKIRKIYTSLMKELNAFLADEYMNYADENGALPYTLLQGKSREARFLEEIVKRVDNIAPELKKEIIALVEETYTNCYIGMQKAVLTATNTKKLAKLMKGTTLRPEVLKQTLNNNITKLTLPHILEKNRQEIIYQIKQELTIGMINGDRYETMARKISERVNVSYSKATNIVRTESHRNVECGFMDCAETIAKDTEGSGIIYTATWRTMQDERVRPQTGIKKGRKAKQQKRRNTADHTAMEGITIIVGDKFKLKPTGSTKCPSMSGIAAQDCQCRCFIEYDILTVDEFNALSNKQINNKELAKKYETNKT